MPTLTFEAALALFKKLWWSIPVVILLIALLFTRHTLANTKQDRDAWHDKFSQQKAQFEIEKVSLDGARAEIDATNKRVEAAAAELQREREQAAADLARANERYKGTAATVAGLEAAAKRKDGPPCKISQEAAHALDGL